MEWKIENNYHGVENGKFKLFELNVVSQKLIPHSFVPNYFILHSLSLVHIIEIKLSSMKWENYSMRIIFSEKPVL